MLFGLFDDFLTDLPTSSPHHLTALWFALVDESVNELVLSIEVSGASTILKPWMKLPVTTATTTIINSINLILSNWLSSVSATTTNPKPFLGSTDSILEVFNIEVSGAAIRLNLDKLPVKFGKSKEDLDVLY